MLECLQKILDNISKLTDNLLVNCYTNLQRLNNDTFNYDYIDSNLVIQSSPKNNDITNIEMYRDNKTNLNQRNITKQEYNSKNCSEKNDDQNIVIIDHEWDMV